MLQVSDLDPSSSLFSMSVPDGIWCLEFHFSHIFNLVITTLISHSFSSFVCSSTHSFQTSVSYKPNSSVTLNRRCCISPPPPPPISSGISFQPSLIHFHVLQSSLSLTCGISFSIHSLLFSSMHYSLLYFSSGVSFSILFLADSLACIAVFSLSPVVSHSQYLLFYICFLLNMPSLSFSVSFSRAFFYHSLFAFLISGLFALLFQKRRYNFSITLSFSAVY